MSLFYYEQEKANRTPTLNIDVSFPIRIASLSSKCYFAARMTKFDSTTLSWTRKKQKLLYVLITSPWEIDIFSLITLVHPLCDQHDNVDT